MAKKAKPKKPSSFGKKRSSGLVKKELDKTRNEIKSELGEEDLDPLMNEQDETINLDPDDDEDDSFDTGIVK